MTGAGPHGADVEQLYRTAGFGAAVPRGRRPGLVVVDLTRGFTEDRFPTGSDLTDVVAATGRLIEAARAAGVFTVFTAIAYRPAEAHGDTVAWLRKAPGLRGLVEGGEAVALDPRLPVLPEDHLLVKKGASAFAGTPLAALLTAAGCDSVLVCGATTSGCVRATAVDAVQAGFDTLVVRECTGDRARGPHDAALFDLAAKYADVVPLDEAIGHLTALTTKENAT
ncbi:isochorismatase family protein [Streptomyces johnsoniae]|uniref:Isochorismatase family protein n=1 Tax=Streptomyces johnsoniae TaxID=3075532 RepID=A0ABU2S879_9ACTN|nr:isochorismatase family protein [Streptomyces sp. DSM 41886]MDT0445187.1 isochorismatase family protein [Streptomyces sp. DSM 41886]